MRTLWKVMLNICNNNFLFFGDFTFFQSNLEGMGKEKMSTGGNSVYRFQYMVYHGMPEK